MELAAKFSFLDDYWYCNMDHLAGDHQLIRLCYFRNDQRLIYGWGYTIAEEENLACWNNIA